MLVNPTEFVHRNKWKGTSQEYKFSREIVENSEFSNVYKSFMYSHGL